MVSHFVNSQSPYTVKYSIASIYKITSLIEKSVIAQRIPFGVIISSFLGVGLMPQTNSSDLPTGEMDDDGKTGDDS